MHDLPPRFLKDREMKEVDDPATQPLGQTAYSSEPRRQVV